MAIAPAHHHLTAILADKLIAAIGPRRVQRVAEIELIVGGRRIGQTRVGRKACGAVGGLARDFDLFTQTRGRTKAQTVVAVQPAGAVHCRLPPRPRPWCHR